MYFDVKTWLHMSWIGGLTPAQSGSPLNEIEKCFTGVEVGKKTISLFTLCLLCTVQKNLKLLVKFTNKAIHKGESASVSPMNV